MLQTLFENILHNLFKPLLLFFYAGFVIPVLGVSFEFPKVIYQGLTIYLLLAIGWRGGEELAALEADSIGQAIGFMVVGFVANLIIGLVSYYALRAFTRLRKIDAATVAGYYGSDSAGTFVTCLGVVTAANIAFAPYMPVMLAVMEIPGCLVALVLISRMRQGGMDVEGNMPGEPGYIACRVEAKTFGQPIAVPFLEEEELEDSSDEEFVDGQEEGQLVAVGAENGYAERETFSKRNSITLSRSHQSHGLPKLSSAPPRSPRNLDEAELLEAKLALEEPSDKDEQRRSAAKGSSIFSRELMHEVFLNPGIFLLFAGIVIGLVSRLQGEKITAKNDTVFVDLFQGVLCLFLLEMGMTASKRLKDLKSAGWGFIAFGLLAPNVFALFGICVAHVYSLSIGQPLEIGTYVLFAVLCGAASYIAVPAVQRMAIPEASPTLPLAASLGLTFSYNVTIGIPVYLMIATTLTERWPVVG